MKLYAPRYYKNFKCISDKCDHSCCIGWEIDIDEDTFAKYKNLKSGYGREIINSISVGDTPSFKLCVDERCPHLDEKGLCKIILNIGEDYLCNICREHPRFYNYTDVAEVGLGMACREAARIILSSSDYHVFDEIGEADADEEIIIFNGREERQRLYAILHDDCDYKTKLKTIYNKYEITLGDDSKWLEIINALEYLNPAHKDLFMKYSSKNRGQGKDEYLERALAYFIYRHCTESYDNQDFCVRLSFCLFCERLLASLINSQNANSLQEIAVLSSIISEEIEYSEVNTESLTYGF